MCLCCHSSSASDIEYSVPFCARTKLSERTKANVVLIAFVDVSPPRKQYVLLGLPRASRAQDALLPSLQLPSPPIVSRCRFALDLTTCSEPKQLQFLDCVCRCLPSLENPTVRRFWACHVHADSMVLKLEIRFENSPIPISY